MALSYIIDKVCEKCGFNPDTQREAIVRIINSAASEVYEMTDLPGCLDEITVLATANSLIALPYQVGELRNMRGYNSLERIELNELDNKYRYNNWPEIWNNWRLMGKRPLQNCIENATVPIQVTMLEAEANDDVVLTIVGATTKSSRVAEVLTLAAGETSGQLNNLFTEIFSISKASANNFDVTFTGIDADGNDLVLAVLPNDRLSSQYTIVDVSSLPNIDDSSTGFRYVEVLFKKPLPQLVNDGDEFICPGFDDAIVYKACEFYWSDKTEGNEKAFGYLAKCQDVIKRKMENVQGNTMKRVYSEPSPYIGLFPRRIKCPYPLY